MKIEMQFNHSEFPDQLLNESISEILDENILMSVSTINGNENYIHTAYFCFNNKLDFFMLTEPVKQHSKNLDENNSVALAIYDSHQAWDKPKKGLQIFGNCEISRGMKLVEGTKLYLQRFSGLAKWIKHADDFAKNIINSKIYIITTNWLKIFHEVNLGEDNFVSIYPKK